MNSKNDRSPPVQRSPETENIDSLGLIKDRHILVAVDDTESSERAVLYVADFLGDAPGFRATLFNLISLPEAERFESEKEQTRWVEEQRQKMEELLGRYRQVLIQSGFPEEKVSINVVVKESHSIAEEILDEQQRIGSCTVVVARHKISRKEEFLFGSTSNKLLHMSKNCSLWIIE